jgi:archaeoflavoprotein AfpA
VLVGEAKMGEKKEGKKKKKVAWGITGSGDRLRETVDVMKKVCEEFRNEVDIIVYVSKAGDQVIKYYKLKNELEQLFNRIWVEANSNSPFLAGQVQSGKFAFLMIAPATSNTVAKIALGLGDSMLSNAAIMGLKASIPLYVMPSDYVEGIVSTELPTGKTLKLKIRKEDVENTRKMARMENVFILEKPEDILRVFRKYFSSKET